MTDGYTGASDGDVRIGTSEREAATAALLDHLQAGRLDLDEYGERAALASVARTRGELRQLFSDLPGPDPLAAAAAAASATPSWAATGSPPASSSGAYSSGARRFGRVPLPLLVARAVFLLPILALVMLIAFHLWFFFLLIPLSGMLRRGSRRQFAGARYRGWCGPGWR
jgi:hypothetical protein